MGEGALAERMKTQKRMAKISIRAASDRKIDETKYVLEHQAKKY